MTFGALRSGLGSGVSPSAARLSIGAQMLTRPRSASNPTLSSWIAERIACWFRAFLRVLRLPAPDVLRADRGSRQRADSQPVGEDVGLGLEHACVGSHIETPNFIEYGGAEFDPRPMLRSRQRVG